MCSAKDAFGRKFVRGQRSTLLEVNGSIPSTMGPVTKKKQASLENFRGKSGSD